MSPRLARLRLIADWRVWLGLGLPAVAIWLTLRDVRLSEVGEAMGRASALGIAAIMGLQLLALGLRALRWRELLAPLTPEPLPLGPVLRAVAVGFMAINVLPFRLGELVRPWLLSRETPVRGSAALGTVVIERALDFTAVAAIGSVVFFLHTQALPGWVRTGATLFGALAVLPVGLIVALRVDETATLALLGRALRLLPPAPRARALDALGHLCRGVNAIQSRRRLALVALQSALLWGVVLPAPFAVGLWAFDLRLPVGEAALAVYTLHVFTALAVAAPSLPGFFGVFHFACREALVLFGVPAAVAVGFGTVLHLAAWLPVTLVGFAALARSGAQMRELAALGRR